MTGVLTQRPSGMIESLNSRWHKLVLEIFGLIVVAHWAEHIAQAVQIYALGWPRPETNGVLGLAKAVAGDLGMVALRLCVDHAGRADRAATRLHRAVPHVVAHGIVDPALASPGASVPAAAGSHRPQPARAARLDQHYSASGAHGSSCTCSTTPWCSCRW
jgi:hypothetical protein